ncbi:MAG: LamG domain-containing protein [Patescibacteria group bacterium]
MAALIVNQTKSADIFTASASGTTKFTIHNDGSITLAGMSSTSETAEGTIYYDTDVDHLYLRTGDAAYHRLAQDMTKYTVNNTSLATGSYVEIAHNQAVDDISTTAWIYDGSKYVRIDDAALRSLNTEDNTLVAWYKMEEASGNLDNAEGTAGNDLTASGSATYQQTGKVNYAIDFDGSTDWFVTEFDADNNNFDFGTGSFSIGGWFKHDTISTNSDYMISKYSDEASITSLGDGADGTIIVSSAKNINTQTIASSRTYADGIAYRVGAPSDSATSVTRYTTVTLSNGISAGDEVMLINLQGASGDLGDVGNYEIMEVQSVTATTITFTEAITKSYDGASAANQKVIVQRVPNYTEVTIQSGGSVTASAWDALATTPTGSAGYYTGIVAFKANGTVSIESGGSVTVSEKGYRGGPKGSGTATGTSGESRPGTGSVSTSANDGGGGGGYTYVGAGNGGDDGGGGGYATTGTIGVVNGSGGTGGAGGGTYGSSDLSSDLFFGSGGGGGGSWVSNGGNGGIGGGIAFISANSISVSGNINAIGQNGVVNTGSSGNGGSGSGGSIFLSANTLTLGSSLVNGLGATAYADGGDGRIYTKYSTSSSGTTTPGAEVSVVTPNSGGYKLYMASDGDIVFGIDDDNAIFPEDSATTTIATYDDNNWHHIVAVKNGTTNIKIYIDGQEVASDTSLAATGSLSNGKPFYLGVDYDGASNSYDGTMDQIFVYNRTLSPGEIEELYRSNSRFYIEQTSNNVLRLYNYTGETQNVRLDAIVFGADLAEWYATDNQSIEAGDVVSITGEKDNYGVPKVRKSAVEGEKELMGIISTKAGQELGIPSEDRKLVGLSGRVPVKIAPDSQNILAGDFLTSSSTYPGMATKATRPGHVVAKALETWNPDSGKSKINSFINVSWHDPSIYLTDIGELSIQIATEPSQVYNNLSLNLYLLLDKLGKSIKTLGVFGQIIAANIKAGAIETKEFTTDSFLAFQGTIDNLIINSNLVSPKIETEVISPIADKNLVIDLENTATDSAEATYGNLIVKGEDGKEVVSIDPSGNATFSGTLESEQVTTNDLYAGKIYADEIVARSGSFANITSASQSSITREEIEEMLREAEDNLASLSSQDQQLVNASGSANISELALENLFVTDIAAITSLSISNSMTLGNDLVFQTSISDEGEILANTIDTLSAPLQIQSLAMAPLEIMAGKFRIETDGNVFIDGNLFIAGNIEAEKLTLKPNQEILESGFGDLLNIQGIDGNLVASINASGSASFNELSTNKLTIAGSETTTSSTLVDGLVTQTNATAGKATLPANIGQITIKNPKITNYTLVYVTPTSSTMNNVLYVKSKGEGFFTVGFSQPIPLGVEFNWWVIDVKNPKLD